ncbi:protein phosphatase 2C domain-containing protein [Henriciella aquimarina]|uniref:protein phosphatase 2C domain-containing protein n=1 Tax=Henriciella aquimarina TaxID=545261 RepID=UPI000A022A7F|nr:protein phosphatase 2C domain-containing protein [Henriciella aquimarina]
MIKTTWLSVLSNRGGSTPNDDRAGGTSGLDNGYAWVIDGATGVTSDVYVPGADSDAAWLAEQLDRYFSDLPRGATPVRVPIRRILGRVRDDYMLAVAGKDVPDFAIPSAAGLFCGWERCGRRLHLRFTGLGDCSAILRVGDGTIHVVGDLSHGGGDAERLSTFAAFSGATDPAAQEALWSHLREQRRLMNRPGGYWVFSITPEAASHMREYTFALPAPVDMLLMTDGFARLIDHFTAYTPGGLIAAAMQDGLDPLYRLLRQLEADDPDCRKAPRVKKEDDASAVLVHIDSDGY